MIRPQYPYRIPFLGLSLILLFVSAWAGLVRMGWALPAPPPSVIANHGALMIGGFLGTVISLERAVALRSLWTYSAPALSGLGALLIVAGDPGGAGRLLITFGSVALVVVFAVIVRRETAPYTITMALGALAWLGGNLLWLTGTPVYGLVPWWAGFLILTILGERLELSRVLRPPRNARILYTFAVVIFVLGLFVSVARLDIGTRLVGAGMVGLVLWLSRYDITRRTIRQKGMVRYIAACMMLGYVGLALSGVLAILFGGVIVGPLYDAMLHALLLGFVFSMIFGHALLIIPAVIGIVVPYRPVFYLHLGLLHFSVWLRIVGDLGGWLPLRQWGGMLNAAALVLFLGATVYAARSHAREQAAQQSAVAARNVKPA